MLIDKIMQSLGKVKGFALDILFPLPEKFPEIKINDTLFCSQCRARLPNNTKICHKNSQYKLGAAASYSDENIRKWIWQLKYWERTGMSVLLGKLLTNYFRSLNLKTENYLIMPIPLSQKRFRRRGFNQAALIAKNFAEHFNLPLLESVLIRQKNAPPQADLSDWDKRRENIKNCFGVLRPDLVREKNIILIDDVFTSGATMSEAAHQLKDFGAKQIIGLVIAKAG